MRKALGQLQELLAETALELTCLEFNLNHQVEEHSLPPPTDFHHFLYSFRLVLGLVEDLWAEDRPLHEARQAPPGRGNYKHYESSDRLQAVELARRLGVKEAALRLGIPTKNIMRWTQKGCDRKPGGGRKRLDS
jgi:hypothetical protein